MTEVTHVGAWTGGQPHLVHHVAQKVPLGGLVLTNQSLGHEALKNPVRGWAFDIDFFAEVNESGADAIA